MTSSLHAHLVKKELKLTLNNINKQKKRIFNFFKTYNDKIKMIYKINEIYF